MKKKKRRDKFNIFLIGTFFLILFFIILRRVSYFPFDKYISFIVFSLFFSLFILLNFNFKKGRFKIAQDKLLNMYFLIMIVYLIISLFLTSYLRINLEEVILWLIGILIFYTVLNSINGKEDLSLFSYGFILIGLISSIVPFLSLLNINVFKGSLVSGRFASFFQYPNTFSSFLFIPIFLSLFKYEEDKKWFFSLLSSFFSITFLLTQSRASIVILFFLILASLIFVKEEKLKVFNDELFLLILIPFLYLFLSSKIGVPLSLLISLFFSSLYGVFSNRIKILSSLYTPLIFLIFCVVLFKFTSSELVSRFLSLFNPSSYEGLSGLSGRNALMLTALRIFKSHPIFGSGPGTYQFVYFKYRPTMIFSKFPHSTPFKFLSETGIVGFGLYILFLWLILKRVFLLLKSNNLLFLGFSFAFLGILLHTFIDFDLSIPAMFYIFFILTGVLFSLDFKKKKVKFIEVKKFLPYTLSLLVVLTIISISLTFGANFYNKGKTFLNIKNYKYAEKNLRDAVLLDPLNSEYHHSLGKTLEFIAVQNKDTNYIKRANEEFKKAVRLNPYFFLYHASLGESYLYLNEKEKGIEEFKKAVELNPLDPLNYVNLASVYEKFGDLENAEGIIKKAIEKGINEPVIYTKLGDIYKAKGDTELAEENYRKAIEIKSNYAEAYYKLGVLYKEKGKIPEAIHNLWLSMRYDNKNFRYRREFESIGAIVEFVDKFSNKEFVIGEECVLKWNITGNTNHLDCIKLLLVSLKNKKKAVWVKKLDGNVVKYRFKIPNLKEGRYKIRVVLVSKFMDKFGSYLSFDDTDYFHVKGSK